MDEIRKLTRMGGDVRKIAALLQSKGRGRDTILAHITPQEAALLKSRGGRGSTNPDTGLLEFEDAGESVEMMPTPQEDIGAAQQFTGGDVAPWSYDAPYGSAAMPAEFTTSPAQSLQKLQAEQEVPVPTPPQLAAPAVPEIKAPEVTVAPEQNLADKAAAATGLSKDALARALGVTVQGLSTALLTRRAQKEAGAAKAETAQLGAPYRAKAQELMSQAQAGQLTPVGQQAVEAARARLAQQQAGRGGVGAAQQATQLEAFRQQLLQQQYDLGVKLAGVADQFALRAIQQGLTADQQVNQMLSQSMSNIGAIFAGSARPQVPGGQ